MSAELYHLHFDGFWWGPTIADMPRYSGIYCVYSGTHNPKLNSVSLLRLLYIGQAGCVQQRVASHEKWPDWKQQLYGCEELFLNAAPLSGDYERSRAEAAMIFAHQPPCNTEYMKEFPFDSTTVSTNGNNDLMKPAITVFFNTVKA